MTDLPSPIKSAEEIRKSIAKVPWEILAHAYHGAGDAPEKLAIFIRKDSTKEEIQQVVGWMWGSILHQGSIYSASPPFLWILIDIVNEQPNHAAASVALFAVQTAAEALLGSMADTEAPALEPVRRNQPGEPVYEAFVSTPVTRDIDEAPFSDIYLQACRIQRQPLLELVRYAIPTIVRSLDNPQETVRMAAVAAALGVLQAVTEEAQPLKNIVQVIGDDKFDPGAWLSVAMVCGELGYDLSAFLDHTDRRVRLSAAMATKTDTRSLTELVAATADPEWIEFEFPNGAAHSHMHLRFLVLQALLGRTHVNTAGTSVVEAICALIAKRAGPFTVTYEWGRVLRWAFVERIVPGQAGGSCDRAPLPETLRDNQKRILEALCAKTELWSSSNGNASLFFSMVQLPYDREVLLSLISCEGHNE